MEWVKWLNWVASSIKKWMIHFFNYGIVGYWWRAQLPSISLLFHQSIEFTLSLSINLSSFLFLSFSKMESRMMEWRRNDWISLEWSSAAIEGLCPLTHQQNKANALRAKRERKRIKRKLICWVVFARLSFVRSIGRCPPHNPPQKRRQLNNTTHSQNNNSISLLAFHAQPQRKELFCVLLWLAAELLAPWGGLHSQTQSIRSLPSSLNYFISFHNSKQRRKQAQVDWFVRSTLSFSFICFHWVGVVALFLSAEPWSAAALITHQKQEQPNSIQQITLLRASCFILKLLNSFTICSFCIRLGPHCPSTSKANHLAH